MINMIRADFYRILKGKLLKISLLFAVVWVFFCSYAQYATVEFRENFSGGEVAVGYWNSFFNYYPVVLPLTIFCACFASADFRQETIKVYIAKGISRWKYFLSKLVVGWTASFLFLLLAFLTGMGCSKAFYGMFFDGAGLEWSIAAYLFCQLLLHASVATLSISIAFFVRNSVACMVINFFLVFFGYLCLHTIEKILGLDSIITMFWALSGIGKASIDYAVLWLPTAGITFAGYFVVFGITSIIHLNRKDVV